MLLLGGKEKRSVSRREERGEFAFSRRLIVTVWPFDRFSVSSFRLFTVSLYHLLDTTSAHLSALPNVSSQKTKKNFWKKDQIGDAACYLGFLLQLAKNTHHTCVYLTPPIDALPACDSTCPSLSAERYNYFVTLRWSSGPWNLWRLLRWRGCWYA